MLGIEMERRIFPVGSDDKGEPYENLRWSRFKNFEAREMMRIVDEHVFPFLRQLGEEGSSYGTHMCGSWCWPPLPCAAGFAYFLDRCFHGRFGSMDRITHTQKIGHSR